MEEPTAAELRDLRMATIRGRVCFDRLSVVLLVTITVQRLSLAICRVGRQAAIGTINELVLTEANDGGEFRLGTNPTAGFQRMIMKRGDSSERPSTNEFRIATRTAQPFARVHEKKGDPRCARQNIALLWLLPINVLATLWCVAGFFAFMSGYQVVLASVGDSEVDLAMFYLCAFSLIILCGLLNLTVWCFQKLFKNLNC